MNEDDGIEARVTSYANVMRPPSVRIGNDVYVFPAGTTDAEAQAVLDEAKRVYLATITAEANDGQ
jgi:hypothetical protein